MTRPLHVVGRGRLNPADRVPVRPVATAPALEPRGRRRCPLWRRSRPPARTARLLLGADARPAHLQGAPGVSLRLRDLTQEGRP